ncbi:RNA polymerase sigma factor [Alkalithermobacter thermoalcaliphilus]|uniref:RNA polymerase sigma factor n=1 Tax=Clostridium paradoxum TaxID=29346 RepID=UPI002F91052A
MNNNEKFKSLYEEYFEYALRTAIAITKDTSFSKDAVQETFIRIYKNMDSLDETKSFKTYLYTILLNECRRILDKNNKAFKVDSLFLENEYSLSSNDIYSFEEYEFLYKAIQNLEDINKIPIILKYLNDFSEKEISSILTININTVKSRLFKGRQKLKKMIEEFEKRSEKYE